MAKAIDVARYLIHLAVASEEPDPLSHLRLQKLLYYAQGWHLAAFGEPLFPESIEAWCNGPVVAAVYPAFKSHGDGSILPCGEPRAEGLSKSQAAFVESLWNEFKAYSASKLWQMTHEEQPWRAARTGLGAKERSSQEITLQALQAFFAPQLAARMPHGIELSQLVKADRDISAGRFVRHEELKTRLLDK